MKLYRTLTTLTVILGLIHISYAQKYELPIDAAHSVVSFSVGFAGGISSIDGRFDDFEGTIAYQDDKDKASLSCQVSIDVKSLNTGNEKRDEDLMAANWFDLENHPTITFKSTSTQFTKRGFLLHGKLNMMGIVEKISIPFEYQHDQNVVFVFGEPRIAAKGTYTIDRTKYSIPKRGFDSVVPSLKSLALSESVEIKLVIMGRGKSISTLLSDEIMNSSVSKGIELYESLEAKYEGTDSYDFGDRSISGSVSNLIEADRIKDALSLNDYSLGRYPNSVFCLFMQANIYEAQNNFKEAIKFYKKVLALNPKAKRAQMAIDRLLSKDTQKTEER